MRSIRHGGLSMLVALLSPLQIFAAMVFFGSTPAASPQAETGYLLMLASYAVVAPLLHITGIAVGIAGLRNRQASKIVSGLGVALNLAILAIGTLVGLGAVGHSAPPLEPRCVEEDCRATPPRVNGLLQAIPPRLPC